VIKLRPYQEDLSARIDAAWAAGNRNVAAVLPTGGGKTAVAAHQIHKHQGAAVAIAHRQELVGQISLALARDQVRHRIIGPKNVIRLVNQLQMEELGTSYYDPNARVGVAGVDTLVRRADELKHWREQVTLWFMDECQHLLDSNKWGKGASMFPNAKGLGVTATPVRADGKGLGRHADGIIDCMVEGPGMRELIEAGYLTDYRIFAPPSDLDMTGAKVGADGDYAKPDLKRRIQKSHVVGDVVAHYLRLAPGKLGLTFASDVETATDIAAKFNAAGVPAEIVSAKTPDTVRVDILRRFKARKILQVVNVDLFGEGTDIPAVEVVSFARPTQSYGLFVQQFGRGLRLMISPHVAAAWDTYTNERRRQFIAESVKPRAIIIDHVGNVQRHGLPDARRTWSLDRRERRVRSDKPDDVIPVKTCTRCTAVYEAFQKVCPFCGSAPVVGARSGPEFVAGDLLELDAATLAKMRGDIAALDVPASTVAQKLARAGLPRVAVLGGAKRHTERQEAQQALRDTMAWWAGYQQALGRDLSESYKRFYYAFGTDPLTAQTFGRADAETLTNRVTAHIETLKQEIGL